MINFQSHTDTTFQIGKNMGIEKKKKKKKWTRVIFTHTEKTRKTSQQEIISFSILIANLSSKPAKSRKKLYLTHSVMFT